MPSAKNGEEGKGEGTTENRPAEQETWSIGPTYDTFYDQCLPFAQAFGFAIPKGNGAIAGNAGAIIHPQCFLGRNVDERPNLLNDYLNHPQADGVPGGHRRTVQLHELAIQQP